MGVPPKQAPSQPSPAPQPLPETPATGSFPGVQRGTRLFSAWSKMLLAQSVIWDGMWSKLKDGSYELKDWYKAIAQSVDLTSTSMEELVHIAAGGAHQVPPWVSFKWPEKDVQSVHVRLATDGQETLRKPIHLYQPGTSGNSVEVYAELKGSTLNIWPADKEPAEGNYIGFVFCAEHAEPLAVVTLVVPETLKPAPAKSKSVAPAKSDSNE